jgi:hypothetical protein
MNKILSTIISSIAFVGICHLQNAASAETLTLDSQGYIRDWLMLAPIPLPDRGTTGDLLLKDQVKDEIKLKPNAGDTIKVGNKELIWTQIRAPKNYFDFNAILDSLNDRAAGFMVTYIECDQEIPDVMMSVGSNDQGRIYFNGVDIYAFTDTRPLEIDADKGRVTLKKGRNVIVFKVINENNSWQGAMRLTDMAGNPLKQLRIKLSPEE